MRSLLLSAAVLCSLSAADPALNRVRSVYLLPMSGGLDQYLANQLAREGRFVVVTDPARAEAVFTDRLGADFEDRMTALYPPPPPPKVEEEKTDKEKKDQEEPSIGSLLGESSGSQQNRVSSFSRGKGNVFLVDRETRQVLWSHYARPRTTRPDELNHIAEAIADKLHDEAARTLKRTAKPDRVAIESADKAPAVAAPPAPPTKPAPAPATAPDVQKPAAEAPKPAPAPAKD